MKATLEDVSECLAPWLRVLRVDGSYSEAEHVDRGADRRDGREQDRAEEDAFWAGRTPAMRRSARVAA
jgi:hypothetical protein